MPLYLVRHAKAGSRHDFDGDDRERPLTNSGRKQAAVLAERLSAVTPTIILSSPYLRCVETVEPLANAVDAQVQTDERLAEFLEPSSAAALARLLEVLRQLPDRAVVCSHGDVIPAIVESLADQGMRIDGTPQWGKASVWVLDRDDEQFVSARSWAPPVID